MRILITGICGFVGSTIANGLREGWPDWEIVGSDNLIHLGSEMNLSILWKREFSSPTMRNENPR